MTMKSFFLISAKNLVTYYLYDIITYLSNIIRKLSKFLKSIKKILLTLKAVTHFRNPSPDA